MTRQVPKICHVGSWWFFGVWISYIFLDHIFHEAFKIIFWILILFLFWNVLVLPPHASRQLGWNPKKHQPYFCEIQKTCFGVVYLLCYFFTSIFDTLVKAMLDFQLLLAGFGKPWFPAFNTISIDFEWFSLDFYWFFLFFVVLFYLLFYFYFFFWKLFFFYYFLKFYFILFFIFSFSLKKNIFLEP